MSSLSESRLDVLLKDDFRQGLDLTSTWALLSRADSLPWLVDATSLARGLAEATRQIAAW